MNEKIKTLLNNFKKLNLSEYPEESIHSLFKNLNGEVGHSSFILKTGESIYRARVNENDEQFSSKSQLSYKPPKLNTTYQRASCPQKSMFYGSYVPPHLESGEINETRVVPSFEAVPWLRDKNVKGIKKITYSRWDVNSDLNLIAVFQHKKHFKANSFVRILMSQFLRDLSVFPDKIEETLAFTTFIADEFAKSVEKDYDYMISAIFSSLVIQQGFDGILFPSVQLEGRGFNIALAPDVADSLIDLVAVTECTAYKLYGKPVIDNDFEAKIEPYQLSFKLEKMIADHAGIENCLEQLGIKSIEELLSD